VPQDIVDELNSAHARPEVTLRDLFTGFFKIGISGFGGVLPFARRMLVEERRWLTPDEFNEVLSLSQFLPGPNIVNVSVIVGRRFQRVAGSVVAPVALMLMPMVILLTLATLYAQVAQFDVVQRATHGVSAAAAGLMISVALKMAQPLRKTAWKVVIALIVFAAIGLARVPLLWVLAAMAPVSYAIAWRAR
jgi:chromate transporter